MSRLLNDQILAQQTSHFETEDLTSRCSLSYEYQYKQVWCYGLNCVPQKLCTFNLCYLWLWPYWEIGALQSWDKVILEYGETYNPVTRALIKRGKIRHRKRQTGKEQHVVTETEIEGMHPQGKGHQALLAAPEARRETWTRFSLRASKGNQNCWHLDFRFLVSGTMRQ